MNVISISTDRNIFKEGSVARARQVEYGTLFSETHIIIFSRQKEHDVQTVEKISPNVWVHPTNSRSKIGCVKDAFRIAREIIVERGFLPRNTVVTTQDPFETGIVGRRLKRRLDFPLHVQVHTDVFSPYFSKLSFLNWFRAEIARKILPQADSIRVVSQRIADSFAVAGVKVHKAPIVLPIFVDVEKIKNSPVTIDLKVKYPQFGFVILIASRISKEKNISFAIEVLKKVLKVYPKTGAVIVGDGPEKNALEYLVKQNDMDKNVVFEGWTDSGLFSYYKTADMFLSTSDFEGYGLTLVEAVASNCPVLSTDVGVAKELVCDKFFSVCPVGDSDCFFDKISALIKSRESGENISNDTRDLLKGVTVIDRKKYLISYRQNIESAIMQNL